MRALPPPSIAHRLTADPIRSRRSGHVSLPRRARCGRRARLRSRSQRAHTTRRQSRSTGELGRSPCAATRSAVDESIVAKRSLSSSERRSTSTDDRIRTTAILPNRRPVARSSSATSSLVFGRRGSDAGSKDLLSSPRLSDGRREAPALDKGSSANSQYASDPCRL